MKVAFPSQESAGMVSPVYGHFGSARFFIIVDSATGQIDTADNNDLGHIHGQCQPLAALGGKTVDAVVVGGIGGGALRKLNGAGIAAYRAVEGTVSENLKLFAAGKLPEFKMEHTCSGHGTNGACVH
jgi:predicted Fe-Mo cluster-binding NifX family protein